ncbi:MAG TPA: 4-hydroxybenzoate octaprenyltransferase, partial [Gemmatimonadetes bacterium]|nr:4-hydroxybenzoate octaprenyltransferase [Gemmatimonadota bacterium]
LGVAVLLALYQQYLLKDRDSERCFRAFLNNAVLGACIFIGIALDYLFRN